MRITSSFLLRSAVACVFAPVVGMAQAATLSPTAIYSGNTYWQNIGAVSYTVADNNKDGLLDVGDTVFFNLAMQKQHWGTHQFDAMKVWLNDGFANLTTKEFKWYYDPTLWNTKYFNVPGETYTSRPWTKGDNVFSFSYTFTKAGIYDLLVSVMCSRDLSSLVGASDDSPTSRDWEAWTANIHRLRSQLQGEDKVYQLRVLAAPPPPPVPEPETYALMLAGLGLLGAIARRRKQD